MASWTVVGCGATGHVAGAGAFLHAHQTDGADIEHDRLTDAQGALVTQRARERWDKGLCAGAFTTPATSTHG